MSAHEIFGIRRMRLLIGSIFAAATFLTVTPARAQSCVGDCDGNRHVSTAELIVGIDISLGRRPVTECPAFNPSGEGAVSIADLMTGVAAALNGCPPRVGTFEITIPFGGYDRTARVTVPDTVDLSSPVPLVLNYHGVGGMAAQAQRLARMDEKATSEGFITVAPQGVGSSWNAGLCCAPASTERVDDVGFTRALIDVLKNEYPIDAARIYATGFSNGSAMVFRLACAMSDVFAAVAPVGGAIAYPGCAPVNPLPMLIINNVDDPVVSYYLGEAAFYAFQEFNDCMGEGEVTQPAETTTCAAYECGRGSTEFCGVSGTSHVWPGGTRNADGLFDATEAVWSFFEGQVLPLPD